MIVYALYLSLTTGPLLVATTTNVAECDTWARIDAYTTCEERFVI